MCHLVANGLRKQSREAPPKALLHLWEHFSVNLFREIHARVPHLAAHGYVQLSGQQSERSEAVPERVGRDPRLDSCAIRQPPQPARVDVLHV